LQQRLQQTAWSVAQPPQATNGQSLQVLGNIYVVGSLHIDIDAHTGDMSGGWSPEFNLLTKQTLCKNNILVEYKNK
jgi:hypothetical protein